MWAAGLAAESFFPPGAVRSAAGQHQAADAAEAGSEPAPEQRVSGGPGKGPCHLEPAETPAEGGQLRPGAAGEETGGHRGSAGQRMLDAVVFLLWFVVFIRFLKCLVVYFQDYLSGPSRKSQIRGSASPRADKVVQRRKQSVTFLTFLIPFWMLHISFCSQNRYFYRSYPLVCLWIPEVSLLCKCSAKTSIVMHPAHLLFLWDVFAAQHHIVQPKITRKTGFSFSVMTNFRKYVFDVSNCN